MEKNNYADQLREGFLNWSHDFIHLDLISFTKIKQIPQQHNISVVRLHVCLFRLSVSVHVCLSVCLSVSLSLSLSLSGFSVS